MVTAVWSTEGRDTKRREVFLQQSGRALKRRERVSWGLREGSWYRAHQPLPRPGGTSGEGCEQGSIKRQRRGQREGKGWEQRRRLMGSVTKGLLTGQGWLDFVLEMKSHSTVLNWW